MVMSPAPDTIGIKPLRAALNANARAVSYPWYDRRRATAAQTLP